MGLFGDKGKPKTDWQTVAGTNAYNAAAQGQSLDMINAAQPDYADASAQGYNMYMEEQASANAWEDMMAMFYASMAPSGGGSSSGDDAYADAQAKADEAAETARIADLTGKRDAYIGNYFDAANNATSYVTEKIAGEKANAAMMGVDYSMTDELKNERISNYFSTIWSEGNQAEMEGSFGEIGSGGFEQSIWRGEGVEAGPEGTVGEEQAGGAIRPRNQTLLDEEGQLSTATALGE